MNKDNRVAHKPFYRSQIVGSAKSLQTINPSSTAKQSSSNSIFRQTLHKHLDREEKATVDPVNKNDLPAQATTLVLPELLALDARKLQDRIAACLALQADNTYAWAISMPLRQDIAPHSWMRLESDRSGELALKLFSTLPSIVEAMQEQIPTLTRALAPWSTGTPTVEANLASDIKHY